MTTSGIDVNALGSAVATALSNVMTSNNNSQAQQIASAVTTALKDNGLTGGTQSRSTTEMAKLEVPKFSGDPADWEAFHMKLQGLMTARSLEQLLPTTEAEKDQAPGLWEAGSTEGSLIPAPSASAESGPASTRSPSKEHQALKDPWTWLICGCNGKAQEIVSAAVVCI
ncbi:unnamed protein product [Vitrella brassicaformis CCMP3155]|uniref:Uncharacterized protein n=2 Tax=Vitrella brassicaformis TaxID=1169539 RepID=A0A0G4FTB4_VITBC|nr:unnamed protein product [Vitrella brassicaformis CCMP3155]|eukprot:CEM17598.1 unnamed protein product [Vitrella brassicaformis CCMP3155]